MLMQLGPTLESLEGEGQRRVGVRRVRAVQGLIKMCPVLRCDERECVLDEKERGGDEREFVLDEKERGEEGEGEGEGDAKCCNVFGFL